MREIFFLTGSGYEGFDEETIGPSLSEIIYRAKMSLLNRRRLDEILRTPEEVVAQECKENRRVRFNLTVQSCYLEEDGSVSSSDETLKDGAFAVSRSKKALALQAEYSCDDEDSLYEFSVCEDDDGRVAVLANSLNREECGRGLREIMRSE